MHSADALQCWCCQKCHVAVQSACVGCCAKKHPRNKLQIMLRLDADAEQQETEVDSMLVWALSSQLCSAICAWSMHRARRELAIMDGIYNLSNTGHAIVTCTSLTSTFEICVVSAAAAAAAATQDILLLLALHSTVTTPS